MFIAAVVSIGCGASDRPTTDERTVGDASVAQPPSESISLSELFDRLDAGGTDENVLVDALLLDDGSGMRLCEALAESYPPQCGGRSIRVLNPELIDADLNSAQGVRWTDRPISLLGWVEGDEFVVT